jgi:hypothetical protein
MVSQIDILFIMSGCIFFFVIMPIIMYCCCYNRNSIEKTSYVKLNMEV